MSVDENDFEDAREHGIDPDIARRANRMYLAWRSTIEEEFPNALSGSPEEADVVMSGAAALLGDLLGLVWVSGSEELARDVLQRKYAMTELKMENLAREIEAIYAINKIKPEDSTK